MIDPGAYPIVCTGDACTGDVILFSEAVFAGSFRKPQYMGERRVVAKIIRDSYGGAKQQHTFTLAVIASDGVEALTPGATTKRKGRNVYRKMTWRAPWPDESARRAALADKHTRGDAAREAREQRKNEAW